MVLLTTIVIQEIIGLVVTSRICGIRDFFRLFGLFSRPWLYKIVGLDVTSRGRAYQWHYLEISSPYALNNLDLCFVPLDFHFEND